MKQSFLSLTVATVMFSSTIALAGDMPGMDMPTTAPTSQPTADGTAVDLKNTVCPVSGDKVGDSKLTATYEGKIYHFCCDECPKAFAKDPAKYAKAVAADPAKYGVKSNP